MSRKTQVYYNKHPNAKYWRTKGDKLWSKIIRKGGVCAVCGRPVTQAHHILTRGSYPKYRHDLNNGIPLCYEHHIAQRQGLISAHGSPLAFIDWLKENQPDKWKWVQIARRMDGKRTITWKESYERLQKVA